MRKRAISILIQSVLRPWVTQLLFLLVAGATLEAQFVSFNDYARGGGTHINATSYGPGASGQLKNISSGAAVAAAVTVYSAATVFTSLQGSPQYATPAFIVFDGYVDFFGDPNPRLELPGGALLTYFFGGVDAPPGYK